MLSATRTRPRLPTLLFTFSIFLLSCKDTQIEDRLGDLEKKLENMSTEHTAMKKAVDCYLLRDKLIDAWLKHKPVQGKCRRQRRVGSRMVCSSTGLPPRTVTPYSKRLARLRKTLRERPEYFAYRFEKLGSAPVPTVDAFWKREKKSKAEYIAERELADKLTRDFLQNCSTVIWGRSVLPKENEEETEEQTPQPEKP